MKAVGWLCLQWSSRDQGGQDQGACDRCAIVAVIGGRNGTVVMSMVLMANTTVVVAIAIVTVFVRDGGDGVVMVVVAKITVVVEMVESMSRTKRVWYCGHGES